MDKTALRPYPEPYLDYGRSLPAQTRSDPTTAGYIGAAKGAGLAAVLGALVARMATDDSKKVALAALLTGLAGGGAGYYAGKGQQESENTRMLALRRAGLDNPAELEIATKYPMLAYDMSRGRV